MGFIYRKYANAISSRLRNFKNLGNDGFRFSCPLCGDSKKNKYKARGHIYRKKDQFFYRCFNCNVSTTFESFLKQVAPDLNNEFRYERFAAMREDRKTFEVEQEIEAMDERNDRLNNLSFEKIIYPIYSLHDNHKAKLYVQKRKIPFLNWKYLYYTDDFKKVALELDPIKAKNMPDNDERVVIATLDRDDKIMGVAARSLDPKNEKKYVHLKASDKYPKLFGMDRIKNFNGTSFVFEGAFDSLFFDNSLATCDSDLAYANIYYKDIILVHDNEPRNANIVRNVKRCIENGFRVCIWPSDNSFKDVNEMIVDGGMYIEDIRKIMLDNTFEGMRAELAFGRWNKI
jgi:hypothetical protein